MWKSVIIISFWQLSQGLSLGCHDFPYHWILGVEAANKTILDFKVRDIDGKDVKLKKYKGNVLLVVNVASKCGYTPQYEGLQATYRKV